MASLEKVLYTANAHTTGGRDGTSRTDDGRLGIKLSSPGTAGTGTNPEQLFAAGYSACFIGAMKAVAGMQPPMAGVGQQDAYANDERAASAAPATSPQAALFSWRDTTPTSYRHVTSL